MHRHGGQLVLICPDETADSYQHERDAQELSHIEYHVLFECNLRVLHELYEYAASEAHDEEYTGESTPVNLVETPFVQCIEHKAKEKVGAAFIKLGGMAGNGFPVSLEDESPGKAGGTAVYLAVEKVSKADEAGGERYRNHQVVYKPHEVEVILLSVLVHVPDEAEDDGYGAAVAGKTALPRHENLPEALPGAKVIVRLVEDAVTQARSHDGADKKRVQERIQQLLVHLFPLEEVLHYEPSQDESAHEQQRIPPELKPADMQYRRVYIPMYYQIFHDAKIVKNGKNQRRFAVNAQTIRVKTTDSIAAPNQNHDTTEKSYTAASAAAPAVLPDSMVNPLTKS